MPPIPGIDLARRPCRSAGRRTATRSSARPRGGAARVAVIGGGLLGLEAARGVASQGCPVTVVHLMDRLMERQLDAHGGRAAAPGDGGARRRGRARAPDRGDPRHRAGDRAALRRRRGARRRPRRRVASASGPRPRSPATPGVEVSRGIVVDDAAAHERSRRLGGRRVRRAPRPGLRPRRADPRAGRASPRARCSARDAAYGGSLQWAKLKVMGVDVVSIGRAEGDARRRSPPTPARRRTASSSLEDGRAAGAILLGDVRGTEDLLEAIRSGEPVADPLARAGRRGARRRRPTFPTPRRSATATASARARSSARCATTAARRRAR